jgi:hypothetical protein
MNDLDISRKVSGDFEINVQAAIGCCALIVVFIVFVIIGIVIFIG